MSWNLTFVTQNGVTHELIACERTNVRLRCDPLWAYCPIREVMRMKQGKRASVSREIDCMACVAGATLDNEANDEQGRTP